MAEQSKSPVFGPGTPLARTVELWNFVQEGPYRITGQYGTRLDYSDDGAMIYCVDVVDAEDNRLTLLLDRSYEKAIVEAENAAREWGVAVDDKVAP